MSDGDTVVVDAPLGGGAGADRRRAAGPDDLGGDALVGAGDDSLVLR